MHKDQIINDISLMTILSALVSMRGDTKSPALYTQISLAIAEVQCYSRKYEGSK